MLKCKLTHSKIQPCRFTANKPRLRSGGVAQKSIPQSQKDD